MKQLFISLVLLMSLFEIMPIEAVAKENQHAITWNACANNIYGLHQRLMVDVDVRIKKRKGGYSHIEDWHYLEEKFFDKNTGKLISQIQWDSSADNQLHTIEVYIRDEQGRVIRDYMAAYLPEYHNAPTQTLISLHRYNKDLHAFRTFDASGYRITERCEGTFQGKSYEMLLDEDEIAEMQYDKDSVMQSEAYKACFGNLQTEAGIYLFPQ